MMTALYDTLDGVADALAKCMKCGNCMAVCPVYPTEKSEASYARGKLAIAEAVLRGDLRLDDAIVQEKAIQLPCLHLLHAELSLRRGRGGHRDRPPGPPWPGKRASMLPSA
jgi:ferredoxin